MLFLSFPECNRGSADSLRKEKRWRQNASERKHFISWAFFLSPCLLWPNHTWMYRNCLQKSHLFLKFFRPRPWQAEVPGPGTELVLQQWPEPQQLQRWNLKEWVCFISHKVILLHEVFSRGKGQSSFVDSEVHIFFCCMLSLLRRNHLLLFCKVMYSQALSNCGAFSLLLYSYSSPVIPYCFPSASKIPTSCLGKTCTKLLTLKAFLIICCLSKDLKGVVNSCPHWLPSAPLDWSCIHTFHIPSLHVSFLREETVSCSFGVFLPLISSGQAAPRCTTLAAHYFALKIIEAQKTKEERFTFPLIA